MEQTRALNALEPFLALSKLANSPRAAADLVTQATSAPNTYVFAELLQTSAIQSLRDSPEHAGALTLLEMFAWGTWQDYVGAKSRLPALSKAQTQKLKLLSLLPLAAKPTTQLTYAHLRTTLDVPTTRALEDLLIQASYSGLVTIQLDPAAARVTITSVAPLRDLRPGAVPGLDAELAAWLARCDGTIAHLDKIVRRVCEEASQRAVRRQMEESMRSSAMEKAGVKQSHPRNAARSPDDDDDDDGMDLDDETSIGEAAVVVQPR